MIFKKIKTSIDCYSRFPRAINPTIGNLSDVAGSERILSVRVFRPGVVFEYNSLFDFLKMIESFSSSSILNILPMLSSVSLKIQNNIRRIVTDYNFSFERIWIYDKWERSKRLEHSLGAVFNGQYLEGEGEGL